MKELILIVEDEQRIAQLVSDYLVASGYETHQIHHGDDVEAWLLHNRPALILMDIMLPGQSGLALCEKIRSQSEIPIILLTARVEESDRLAGLELGADDYICKPFSPKEVVARVKVILRRYQSTQTKLDEANAAPTQQNIQFSPQNLQVTIQKVQLQLTAVEFAVFQHLVSSPGDIFSREQLMHVMYQDNRIVSDRTIDSHIKKLRKKIAEIVPDAELIQSVYGAGYRYNEDALNAM